MTTFDDLSVDDIYELCQGMDTQELNNFMQSSSKVYNICRNIINSRKVEFQSNNGYLDDVKSIESSLASGKEVRVSKNLKTRDGTKFRVFLEVIPSGGSFILKQSIYGPRESTQDVKWILSDVRYNSAFDGTRSAIVDKSRTHELAENIANQNYERIYY